MNLDILDDLGSLHSVTMLEERLQHSAAIMLEAQLVIFGTDKLEALLNDGVLLLVRDL